MIYTLTFNPAIDYSMNFETIAKGTVNRSSSESIHYGGKGINVSTVLSTLGTDSTALGFIAGFTGAELRKGLERMGVSTDLIELDSGLTRICVKVSEECGETELNAGGPEIPADKLELLMEKLDKLGPDDTLVLAGSVPRSVDRNIYHTICSRLFSRTRIAADASGELLTSIMHFHPWLIKPNHIEAEEICGRMIDSHQSAEECAIQLRAMGAMNVVISMADKGAVLAADDGNVYRITAPSGKVASSVGAGDAFLAGFLAGHGKTGEFREALRWGTAAGSATAFTDGLCSKADFDRLLSEVHYG